MWHFWQVKWVASTQDHSRGKTSRIFVFILSYSLGEKQGDNLEHVGDPCEYLLLPSTAQGVILHRVIMTQKAAEQGEVPYVVSTVAVSVQPWSK